MELLAGPAHEIYNPIFSLDLELIANEPFTFFQRLIPGLITLALIIGVIIFLFMLIMGGIQWISSGGDKASIEMARNKIVHAIIGLVILFSVWALIKIIELFFGINVLQIDLEVLKI
jgi:uncharacterized membrane protein (UPF0182 family)